MDIVIIDIIVILAVCFGVVFSKVLFRSYWAPFGVLSLLWGTSLLWLSVMTFNIAPFHTLTWLAILLAWSSALFGSLFAVVTFQIASNKNRLESNCNLFVKYKKWVIVLGILSLIGSIRFSIIVVNYFGIEGFFANPLHARTMLTMHYSTGKPTLIFQGVTYVAAVLSGIWVGRQFRCYLLYLPLLAGAIFSIFFVGRAHAVGVVILFVCSFLLADRSRIKWQLKTLRKNIGVYLIGIIFFAVPIMFVSQYRSEVPIDTYIPQVALRFLDFFEHWYLLDKVIQEPSPYHMGVNIFPAFIRSLYYIGLRGDDGRHLGSGNLSIEMPLGSTSNKYPIVSDLYTDFGFLGIFFYMFLFGLISGYLFCLYKKYNRLIALAILPFFYHGIFSSFTGSNLGFAIVFGVLIAITVSALIEKHYKSMQKRMKYKYGKLLNPVNPK